MKDRKCVGFVAVWEDEAEDSEGDVQGVVEVTDYQEDGAFEIMLPLPDGKRAYLTVDALDLYRTLHDAMRMKIPNKK